MLDRLPNLYVGDEKVQAIYIIGEDRFSGGDEKQRKGIRSVRISDDISPMLDNIGNKKIKLIFPIR